MAIQFADGFDLYANVADVLKGGWGRSHISVGLSTTNGRFGGGCLQIVDAPSDQGWSGSMYAANGETIIIGFAFRQEHSTSVTVGNIISTALFSLRLSGTGVLTLLDQAGSTVGTSGAVVTQGQWHYIELKVTLGTNDSNGVASVRVNEDVVISATGQDFFSSGLNFISTVTLGGPSSGSGGSLRFDDVIIIDETGSDITDFIGDTRIDTIIPNADGGVVDWTASAGDDYETVDDTPNAANDDTDYISSNTPGQESRFAMTDLGGSLDIHALQVRLRARKDNAGTRTIRGLVNSNSNEALGPAVGLSTDYAWLRNGVIYENPDGDVAWDVTSVNAVQAGVEVVT